MKALAMMVFVLIFGFSCRSKSNPDKLKQLGTDRFSSELWLKSQPDARSSMVYDLVANHGVLGMTRTEIVALLGQPTAYYDYDEFPAYQIGEPSTTEQTSARLIAFITDRKTGRITHYVIEPPL